jgi:hypothetical protein
MNLLYLNYSAYAPDESILPVNRATITQCLRCFQNNGAEVYEGQVMQQDLSFTRLVDFDDPVAPAASSPLPCRPITLVRPTSTQ